MLLRYFPIKKGRIRRAIAGESPLRSREDLMRLITAAGLYAKRSDAEFLGLNQNSNSKTPKLILTLTLTLPVPTPNHPHSRHPHLTITLNLNLALMLIKPGP